VEVDLTPDHEAFIRLSVRNGRFKSPDDAVREAVDLLAKQERNVRDFVQEGLDELEAGNFEDFTDANLHELFDAVTRRGRERLAAQRS
jgi:putative addiction module CopG family antidote